MNYTNPVLPCDFSDPDVIRVGDDFYMVASSFNFVPGVPVLHSKNLVEWELINYVLDELPAPCVYGGGAWAPSLRYYGGKFYCLIPFPDDGVYVAETEDIYGRWEIRPLIERAGVIDPCPIWADGKCYIVCAFARSRTGLNSVLALFEADEKLTWVNYDYRIIFDGQNIAPTIEGPKIYRIGEYYHILAPAGGVKSGWQMDLRSKNIYGGYEAKIVLMQGDTDVNGPHQGALIDLENGGKAFMHFQDMGAYGRVVHLQPAQIIEDWIICGAEPYAGAPGLPVSGGEYPVAVKTDLRINPSDDFKGERLSLNWQTPINVPYEFYRLKDGLRLKCLKGGKSLGGLDTMLSQKVYGLDFTVNVKCKLNFSEEGDEAGFCVFGRQYYYVCAVRRDGRNYLELRKGALGGEADETLARSQPYDEDYIKFKMTASYEDKNRLAFKFAAGGVSFAHKFYAFPGIWTGARLALYARSQTENSKGFGTFKYFKVSIK